MSRAVRFGLTISEERLGDAAPVLIQGGLVRGIERAAAWGFDAVEIHLRNPRDLDARRIEQTASRAGVCVAALGTGLEHTLNGLNLVSPDVVLRRRTVDRFREHIDLAARFGATVFVGLCRGSIPEPDQRDIYADRLAEVLRPLAQYAEERGASLCVEPIAAYMTNFLNSTAETLAFLSWPGLESVMLLMDTHHMHFEDGDIDTTFRMCGDRIAHVHVSDSDRKFPGSGEIDYGVVGKSLKGIGYDKTVSLEVLPSPDGETAARMGLVWMKSVWGE